VPVRQPVGGRSAARAVAGRAGGPTPQLRALGSRALRPAHTTVAEIQANWKVLIENHAECLHCAGVRPEMVTLIPAYRSGSANEGREDFGMSLATRSSPLTASGTSTLPPCPTSPRRKLVLLQHLHLPQRLPRRLGHIRHADRPAPPGRRSHHPRHGVPVRLRDPGRRRLRPERRHRLRRARHRPGQRHLRAGPASSEIEVVRGRGPPRQGQRSTSSTCDTWRRPGVASIGGGGGGGGGSYRAEPDTLGATRRPGSCAGRLAAAGDFQAARRSSRRVRTTRRTGSSSSS